MANKKISQLTGATTPLTGTEELAIVQNGQTVKATIEDVKGYKVYTALLTQSGGDDPLIIYEGDLTIGVTYSIDATLGPEYDFSNVGGPKYPENFPFVATGTTPNNWGAELLYNTGAPVVTVLENTIGNIWFTYADVGRYEINLSNYIEIDKTFLYIGNGPTVNQLVYFEEAGIKTITFNGFSGSASTLMLYSSADGYTSFVDGKFNKTPIEIRVYN